MTLPRKSISLIIHKSMRFKPENERQDLLVKAFSSLENEHDAGDFLRDLMTLSEIQEFANRLYISKLLMHGGYTYYQIAQEVGTSTTTVTRVAQWLNKGHAKYYEILRRVIPEYFEGLERQIIVEKD